jgi:hypothetical protein
MVRGKVKSEHPEGIKVKKELAEPVVVKEKKPPKSQSQHHEKVKDLDQDARRKALQKIYEQKRQKSAKAKAKANTKSVVKVESQDADPLPLQALSELEVELSYADDLAECRRALVMKEAQVQQLEKHVADCRYEIARLQLLQM